MEKFPESFTPDQFTDDELLHQNRLRQNIYDSISREAKRVYAIPIDDVEVKIVTKIKTELEALGWETKVSEFQHLNRTTRSLKVANPLIANGQAMRRDAFGGMQAQPRGMSAFAKRNLGGAAQHGGSRKNAF